MKELREITAKHPWNLMTTSADKGQFLNILLKLINAKNIMEIGVFTGYSLLDTTMALPDDGKIPAMDINRENYEIGLPIIEKVGLAHKIDFKEGSALSVLDQIIEDNGLVVAPLDEPLRKYVGYYRNFVMELNKALTADPRIKIYQLPIGDGITLCRRIS
ncbi:Caffeoyl-CoA O-methyltransferase [Capsicum baccatum]|uniref:caffeoyl-CoA O-methyltransferase n=1 Tax=Capsicum baccatum TaxID=33114 RepID=A0A2G2VY09_CAPBA|nr:Caffeoyl-CoA O-methyltransferase [Capsicum baccatum]